ncbi:maternal B9.10 protein-like [Branchiostoma floridae x Branchiostoma belcheri]
MKDEIAAAVVYLTRLVRKSGNLNKDQVDRFADKLTAIMVERFKNHWYPDCPEKGQAYRCIRLQESEPVDTVLEMAAIEAGLRYQDLGLANSIIMWVDPMEVSCRFGHGFDRTVHTIARFDNKQPTIQYPRPSSGDGKISPDFQYYPAPIQPIPIVNNSNSIYNKPGVMFVKQGFLPPMGHKTGRVGPPADKYHWVNKNKPVTAN